MPALRDNGPYIHPSWLPRLLIGMDHCEHKSWFQAHHDGRTWTKVASDFDSVTYNLRHTDLMKRCAQEYEERGYSVTLENKNEFRLSLAGATVSGRMDLVATRDQDLVIIDAKAAKAAKAAKPSEAHAVQVMLYMLFIQLQGSRAQGMTVTGEVYYGEDHTVPIAAGAAGEEFREMVVGDRSVNRQDSAQEGPQRLRVPLLSHSPGILPRKGRIIKGQLGRCTAAHRHACTKSQRRAHVPTDQLQRRKPPGRRRHHHLQLLRLFRGALHQKRADQSWKALRPVPEVGPCPHRN